MPIMLDYRDISLMESVPLLWRPVTTSAVGIEPMTISGGAYNWNQYMTPRILRFAPYDGQFEAIWLLGATHIMYSPSSIVNEK